MNKHQQERLEAAIDYADKGWRVLPVGLDKKPINFNGSKGATTDARQIVKWWTDHPFANIGIACGPESFWVVDIDMKSGVDGLQSLRDYFGPRCDFDGQKYLMSKTATGGFHLLFQWPQGVEVHNAQGILPGVDVRGEGGYIVVPPSARKIGDKYVPYRWNNGALPIAPMQDWCTELLAIQKESRSKGVDVEKAMKGLSSGERDESLFRLACLLAGKGVDYDLAKSFMSVCADRCNPPFSQSLVEEKLKRAFGYERKPSKNEKLLALASKAGSNE